MIWGIPPCSLGSLTAGGRHLLLHRILKQPYGAIVWQIRLLAKSQQRFASYMGEQPEKEVALAQSNLQVIADMVTVTLYKAPSRTTQWCSSQTHEHRTAIIINAYRSKPLSFWINFYVQKMTNIAIIPHLKHLWSPASLKEAIHTKEPLASWNRRSHPKGHTANLCNTDEGPSLGKSSPVMVPSLLPEMMQMEMFEVETLEKILYSFEAM